jgi:O-Antigen ligase
VIQRIWCVLVFLILTAEFPHVWAGKWQTPWHFLIDLLGFSIAHIPVLDFFIVILLFVARGQPGAKTGRAKPVEKVAWFSIGAMLTWAIYGALRGGSTIDMRLQLHTFVMLLVASMMQIYLLRTREHFRMLAKTVVYAALFRAAMMVIFYITILRSLNEAIETVTDHGDSILFVTTIVIVIANAIHTPSRKATWQGVLVTIVMLWAIQINNRRLAWVSLVGSLAVILALMWNKALRRRLLRYSYTFGPIVALYVAVGWSHPTGIFKPLASLQSVNDTNNPSTQSRILENMGLIITLQSSPLTGTGFGHKYIEISDVYSVKGLFQQYRYVPHNSVLGLVAFTGALGFACIWMIFPVVAYYCARSYAFAKNPLDRSIAMVGLCEVVIHTNQMWGDIGICAFQGLALMSAAIAAASRVSVLSGAWPGTAAKRQSRPAAE